MAGARCHERDPAAGHGDHNISLEHQNSSVPPSRIAREKAGIIKKKVPLVTAVTQPAPSRDQAAACGGAPWYRVGQHLRVRSQGARRFSYTGSTAPPGPRTPLSGRHQVLNRPAPWGPGAPRPSGKCGLSPDQISEGLIRTRWPGDWSGSAAGLHPPGRGAQPGRRHGLRRALQEEFTATVILS